MFDYNLYGDPALDWTGRLTTVDAPDPPAGGPDSVRLANYPNPFNPVTMIEYELPAEMHVTLEIFDTLGRRVARLVDALQPAGKQNVRWDARTEEGTPLASGIYFCRLVSGDETHTRALVLLK
jgi:hypothetical protein